MINHKTNETPSSPPPSCTNYSFNLLCLVFFFAAMFALHRVFPGMRPETLTLSSLLAMALPLWMYDLLVLKVHLRPSTGLSPKKNKPNIKRLSVKLVGLFATFLIILLLYHLIPFFRHSFYKPFFSILNRLMPLITIISILYCLEVDRRQKDPYDEYWHMGCLVTGRFKDVDWTIIREHARCWLIKAFFTPHVFGFLVINVQFMVSLNGLPSEIRFLKFYNFALVLIYMIDIIYAALGYIMTLRVLDTHIRSTEPTGLGWLVCLMCYYPIAQSFGIGILPYEDGFLWNDWFMNIPFFYYFYGIVIIFLTSVYALATVAFGYRYSNLTFRGLITAGPYRYTKHPAYLCKVLSWWLIAVPFFSYQGAAVALKNCFFLGVISLIYYLRAVTEENHLSNYPQYVRYAEWINDHGAFRLVKKYVPGLRYSYEKTKKWGSVVWFKK